MIPKLKARWDIVRELFRGWQGKLAIVLTVLSTYDLVLSQLLPEAISRQLPRLYDVLLVAAPWIPAWAIPMTILTLLGFSAMAAVNRRFSALGVTLAGFDQKLADVRSLNDQNLADVPQPQRSVSKAC